MRLRALAARPLSDGEPRAWEPQWRRKQWPTPARLKARSSNWSTWRFLLYAEIKDHLPRPFVKQNIAKNARASYPTGVSFRPDRGLETRSYRRLRIIPR